MIGLVGIVHSHPMFYIFSITVDTSCIYLHISYTQIYFYLSYLYVYVHYAFQWYPRISYCYTTMLWSLSTFLGKSRQSPCLNCIRLLKVHEDIPFSLSISMKYLTPTEVTVLQFQFNSSHRMYFIMVNIMSSIYILR